MRAKILGAALCAIPLATIGVEMARAGADECRRSTGEFEAALPKVSKALERYADCVSTSGGRNDCTLEFERLRMAHRKFETAVWKHAIECD